MADVFQIADTFTSHVRSAYAQDVSIVAYYGSYATGTASAGSDLDMYYIPDDGKAMDLYRSFVVEGMALEFWPVSWGFAEEIAAGKHRWAVAPSMIVNAQVMYSRSDADLARFDALKAQIASLQKPESKNALVAQAWENFKTAPFYLETLRLSCACGDVLGSRWMGCQFVNVILDCLALVNQTFFNKDWTGEIEAIRSLPLRPERLVELIETIITSSDVAQIQGASEDLLKATRDILVQEQNIGKESPTLNDELGGYYAAIHEYASKIASACEKRNLIKASYVASMMQCELALMLAQVNTQPGFSDLNFYGEYGTYLASLGWPDLAIAIGTGDYGCIAVQAQVFVKKVKEYLVAHSVDMNMFETLEDAQPYICGTSA